MVFLLGLAPLPPLWHRRAAVKSRLSYLSACNKRSLYTTGWSLKSTFTYRQLLNYMCLVFIYRTGHAFTKSHTSNSLLFVLALLCLFDGWRRWYTRMGRGVLHARMRTSASRFSLVTCPFASSLCDASSPIVFGTPSCKQTLLLTEKRRQVTVELRHHRYARAVPWMSNGHSMFFRPGHDLRPFFIPETLRRRSASLLFWVKFICPAGVSSSCYMVVIVHRDVLCSSVPQVCRRPFLFELVLLLNWRVFWSNVLGVKGMWSLWSVFLSIGASITLGPSEGVSPINTHSSKWAFFKVSSALWILSVGNPFCFVFKCWCGTIAARFSQVAQRHCHDLCRFSLVDVHSRWRRQLHVVRTIWYVWPPH